MPTFTLSVLEQRVWDGLDYNSNLYPEPNVRGVINEGLCRLNLLTGFNQASVNVPGNSVAGQQEYSTPSGIGIPLRCDFNGRELSHLSLPKLAARFPTWSSDLTTKLGAVQRWTRIGISRFIIHPIDATGGNTLTITGVAPVTPLVNGGDPVNLDDQFVDILIGYGRSRIMLKEGGKPFADASLAYQEMVRKVKRMVAWEGMSFPAYWLIKETEPDLGRGAGLGAS